MDKLREVSRRNAILRDRSREIEKLFRKIWTDIVDTRFIVLAGYMDNMIPKHFMTEN